MRGICTRMYSGLGSVNVSVYYVCTRTGDKTIYFSNKKEEKKIKNRCSPSAAVAAVAAAIYTRVGHTRYYTCGCMCVCVVV